MFRQLLSSDNRDWEEVSRQDMFFPNINQLIKTEPICGEKSLVFVPFVKINPKTQVFEFFIDVLEDFREEKVKFVTKIDYSEDESSYIEISQSPIHIDQGCNYFLLNAFCGNERLSNFTASKSKTGTFFGLSETKNNKKQSTSQVMSSKQILFNLVYMLSYWIFIRDENLRSFLQSIHDQSLKSTTFFNRLSVVKLTDSSHKKRSPQISSTAAETKAYQRQLQMSDIFDDEFSFYHQSNILRTSSPKNLLVNKDSKRLPLMIRSRQREKGWFSRVGEVQMVSEQKWLKKIIEQVCAIEQPVQRGYYLYPSICQLLTRLSHSRTLLSLDELTSLNLDAVNSHLIQTIFSNYQSSLEQQFNEMSEQSIQDIKSFLKQLYDRVLCQFYEQFSHYAVKDQQEKWLNQLLKKVYEAEAVLFANINKGKREMFQRRITMIDEQCANDKIALEEQTKFEMLLGDRLTLDQQIGFGLYRQTIKSKSSQIFSDFTDQTFKKSYQKSHNGRSISKNTLSLNMQRRIQILLFQKRNIQQSLHYEQRLQENLLQYMNSQSNRRKTSPVEVISQLQEDVQ